MTECLFVSDLHGHVEKYRKLFGAALSLRPRAIFIGGDILPHFGWLDTPTDFVRQHLLAELDRLRRALGAEYPRVFAILGNDDPRVNEESLIEGAAAGLLSYVHMKKEQLDRWTVYGYAMTPPSPFPLKDWEQYDVSQYVDPGSVSPEEGLRSVPVEASEVRHATIAADLGQLAGSGDLGNAVLLFHAPPYGSVLDRAPLEGKSVDHVPLDLHIGSVAIRRFIEERQPLLTLHGHAHESARITGQWREHIGRTLALSAAHDGRELALVRLDLENPDGATRELV